MSNGKNSSSINNLTINEPSTWLNFVNWRDLNKSSSILTSLNFWRSSSFKFKLNCSLINSNAAGISSNLIFKLKKLNADKKISSLTIVISIRYVLSPWYKFRCPFAFKPSVRSACSLPSKSIFTKSLLSVKRSNVTLNLGDLAILNKSLNVWSKVIKLVLSIGLTTGLATNFAIISISWFNTFNRLEMFFRS